MNREELKEVGAMLKLRQQLDPDAPKAIAFKHETAPTETEKAREAARMAAWQREYAEQGIEPPRHESDMWNYGFEAGYNAATERTCVWTSAEKDAPYDGQYLCCIEQPQECGNVWQYQRVVANKLNKWQLQEGEKLIAWMPLPPFCTRNNGGRRWTIKRKTRRCMARLEMC